MSGDRSSVVCLVVFLFFSLYFILFLHCFVSG